MKRFAYPVKHNVSQGFGANPAYYKKYGQRGHNGIDLAVGAGTAVRAAADGTVYFEGWGKNNAWMGQPAGICVLIDHGDVYTGYAHMTSTIVNKGQKVKQGQTIGYVGSTGAATGPHVHFEFLPKPVKISNGYYGRVNPSVYMNQSSGGGDDVITSKDIKIIRYVTVYIKGWGKKGVFDGKNDKSELAAWTGKPWTKYLNEAIKEGGSYLRRVDKALAYYAKKSSNDKALADAKKSASDAKASVKTLEAQNKQQASEIAANAKEIAELERQLSERPTNPSVTINEQEVVQGWLKRLWDSLFKK